MDKQKPKTNANFLFYNAYTFEKFKFKFKFNFLVVYQNVRAVQVQVFTQRPRNGRINHVTAHIEKSRKTNYTEINKFKKGFIH